MPKPRKPSRSRKPAAVRQRPTAAQRRAVENRAGGVCEYCHCLKRFVPEPFNVEHVIPVVRGGKTEIGNLAWACAGCNYHKHDKVEAVDPQTDLIVALFNPRRHRWEEHFAWNEDAKLMIGLTATGRATIHVLWLNREELINLRWALSVLNLHPPA
ncbi:MAG: HNH endonuclease [Blastocatellia bacterium]